MKKIWFAAAAIFVCLSGVSAQDQSVGFARVRTASSSQGAPIVPLEESAVRSGDAIHGGAATTAPTPMYVPSLAPVYTSAQPYGVAPPAYGSALAPHTSYMPPVAGGHDSGSCGCDAGPVAKNRFLGPIASRGHIASSCSDCSGKYGLHPLIKKLFWWRKDCDCEKEPRVLGRFGGLLGGNAAGHAAIRGLGNCGAPGFGAGYPTAAHGENMPGTLVFPNHPFVRSPRDFFMQDPR